MLENASLGGRFETEYTRNNFRLI